MDSQTAELLRRSHELLAMSRSAHESADSVRKKLQELEFQNREILVRCAQTIKSSEELLDSTLHTKQ